MKNIHILPTDKPSRLYSYKNNLFLTTESHLHVPSMKYQNIYITSDEEIKEGDWYYNSFDNAVRKNNTINHTYHHKIILTTDPDLIADGVQAIDDEFLEWFVKNPSCKFVEVKLNYLGSKCLKCGYIENHNEVDTNCCPKCSNTTYKHLYENKIIIPQEEHPNQIKCYCGHTSYCDCSPLDEPKQETLEEAAERYAEIYRCPATNENEYCKHDIISAFNKGAKWQTERMYGEEDMLKCWNAAYIDALSIDEETYKPLFFADFIKQYKKK